MSTETAKQNVAVQRVASALPTEVGITAAAAETAALVQSRFVMAVKKPRNLEQVRQDLLKECSRPSFALEEKKGEGNSALYIRPVGNGKSVEGLGIRFAEVAIRCMTNIMQDALVIQDSDLERVLHVLVLDLESNTSYGRTITISKTVERLTLKDGEVPIKQRVNSAGKTTYTVLASESALVTKEAAELSKTLRTLALRLIPGDFQDECIAKIKEIRRAKVAEDPDAAKRLIIDGMALQSVTVVMLEGYLDHPIDQCTPAEIMNLQALYSALRDGETTWRDVMADVDESRKKAPKTKQPDTNKPAENGKGVEAAKAKIEAEALKKAEEQKVVAEKQAAEAEEKRIADEAAKKTVAPTGQTVTQAPAAQSEPAKASSTPPWAKPKPAPAEQAPTATAPSEPASLSLEDQVAEMAAAKPVVERKKPKAPMIKGLAMPEFVDSTGPEDAPSPEQLARLEETFSRIPGKHDLGKTIFDSTGVDLDEINAESLEVIIQVLETYTQPKTA